MVGLRITSAPRSRNCGPQQGSEPGGHLAAGLGSDLALVVQPTPMHFCGRAACGWQRVQGRAVFSQAGFGLTAMKQA